MKSTFDERVNSQYDVRAELATKRLIEGSVTTCKASYQMVIRNHESKSRNRERAEIHRMEIFKLDSEFVNAQ